MFAVGLGAQTMVQPKGECDSLMNAVLPVAEKMLKEHGEFFPYGGAMRPTGEIVSVAGYDGREKPPSADIIRLLKTSFRQSAQDREYKATAIVYDVRIVPPQTGIKSDAIAVALEHRDDYSVVVFFPYRIARGELIFGETFAQKGGDDVFARK